MSSRPSDSRAIRERLQQQLRGSYVVGRELSAGGSAFVFLAKETALDRTVVVKVLPPELNADVDAERFRREIHFAASLQHPHLVPLLNAAPDVPNGDQDQLRWFSMPYIAGNTLRELLLRRGAPPLVETLRLLREIALGLAYAHARGVVHRDIKPENILLNDGIAMISDFGVAKALDEASDEAVRAGRRLTTVGTALGTPDYMSPEQVRKAAVVDHRADIYAFGCVAYELLTGAPPFSRSSFRATLAAQLTDAPTPLTALNVSVPHAVTGVVMRCLAKNPADRPHSATVIVRAIEGLNASNGTYETANDGAHVSPASTGKRPLFGVIMVLLALCALALFITVRA